MKRRMIATFVAAVMLMSGCSNVGQTAVSAGTTAPETTTEETTEETITTTTAAPTTTETTMPSFSAEQHAGIFGDWGTDFDFGSNAKFQTAYDKESKNTYPQYPNYAPGETVTITFKSEKKLELGCIVKVDDKVTGEMDLSMIAVYGQNPGMKKDGITPLQKKCTFSEKDGIYTVTIPGKLIESNRFYLISLIENKSKKKNEVININYNFGIRCYVE